jgi:hypothetical protein
MIYCDICKTKEATNFHQPTKSKYCDTCYVELCNSFTYYIGGKEVTKEEYYKFIEEEKYNGR